jgi:hypothetical protein
MVYKKWCGRIRREAGSAENFRGKKEDPLNLSRAGASLALASLMGLVACSNSTTPPATPQSAPATQPPPSASATPANSVPRQAAVKGSIWKSETTGKEYRVWTEKEQFHAEWTNIPPQFAAKGAHISSTGARKGQKWLGESQNYLPCSAGEGKQEHIANFCQLTTGFEVDSMSATRITGQGEALKRFDCAKCKVLEKEWKNFVWVPKK